MQLLSGRRLAQYASTLPRPRPPVLWPLMPRVVQYMPWRLLILHLPCAS